MKFEIFTPVVIHELGQRDNQEDSVFPPLGSASDSDRLFLVCDGMGGHAKGEVASANVVDAMTTWIKQRTPDNGIVTDDIIENALQYAHQQLDKLDDGAENKMGTTLTLVCLHKGGVTMGHVGDSRIYHVRPSQRKILYKSIDHSLVYELYRSGVISYDDMATSPQRNVITRAIMPGEENNDNIDLVHTTNVKPGDYFYLCSDGMLEEMTDDQLLNVLCAEASDVMKAGSLVSMTADNKDNHTAVLIKVKSVLAEDGDAKLLNDEATSEYNEMAVANTVVMSNDKKPNPVVPPYKPEKKSEALAQAKPEASVSPQKASTPATASVAPPKKGGVNKVLLLLVLLLFSLVVAGAVYLFMNNGNDNKEESEDNEVRTEHQEKFIDKDKEVNDVNEDVKYDDNKDNDLHKRDRKNNVQRDKQKKEEKQKIEPVRKEDPKNNESEKNKSDGVTGEDSKKKENTNLNDAIRSKQTQQTTSQEE